MNLWPDIPYESWKDTLETVHRWTQIVGKVALACTPRQNHFWNVGLHPTAMGLRTNPMQRPDGGGTFDMTFDFIDHALFIRCENGERRTLPLVPCTVKAFHDRLFATFEDLGFEVSIREEPSEIAVDAIPFAEDEKHRAYDEKAMRRFFTAVSSTQHVLDLFTAQFVGKVSPVLFWWGTFDLSVSRYSGRTAPPPASTDSITDEAYSHEVSSAGFWAGDAEYPHPAFFSYTMPAPDGYTAMPIGPAEASFNKKRGLFLLPYEVVRDAASPARTLLEFYQSTYEAGADAGGWDRENLERQEQASARTDDTSVEATVH